MRIITGINITANDTEPAQPLNTPKGFTSNEYINVPIIIVGILTLTSAKLLINLPNFEYLPYSDKYMPPKIPIGIPMGTDIEYLDPVMITKAWEDRKVIS